MKSREELMKLPLRDERGGGRKEKRHVPHHLFDQRLYSTIHSYLATLANCKLSRCGLKFEDEQTYVPLTLQYYFVCSKYLVSWTKILPSLSRIR